MSEQTTIDLIIMQELFTRTADRVERKGFSEEAHEFKETCKRLTSIIERNSKE